MNSLKLWMITIGLLALLLGLWYFSDILMMFVISAAVAFLLSPAVNYLQRKFKTNRRVYPTIIVFLCAIAVIVALIALLVPVLYSQIVSVVKNIGQYASTITGFLDHIAEYTVSLGLPQLILDVTVKLTSTFENFIVNLVANLGTSLLEQSTKALDVVIFLCLTFYFMLDGRNIYQVFVGLFSQNGQVRIHRIAQELKILVWNYLKQHIVISSGMFIVAWIGFMCFGLEYALLLALITFFLDFIPYIGSIIAGLVAVASAFITGGISLAFWVLVFVIVLQQIEGNVIMPKFQAKCVAVHPMVIIFSLLACNKLWGIFGMFISVPVAGLVKVLLIELRDLYRSIDRPGGFGSADESQPLAPLIQPSPSGKEKAHTILDKLVERLRRKKS